MALFSWKKKVPKPAPFLIGVFGKLPFYKDFLYSSFHPAFTELRELIDQGMDRLIRAENPRPYVAPNRRLLLHMAKYKVDLVASIWESDDGLRGFPFLLATAFSKKLKQAPFPVFWQGLQAYWTYFTAFHEEVLKFSSPTEFYGHIRGVQHQLPDLEIQDWAPAEAPHPESVSATRSLDDGLLCPIDLTGTNAREEQAIIRGLRPESNPNFIMWPEPAWRDIPKLAVTAYLGSSGIEDLRMDFLLPEYAEEEPDRGPTAQDATPQKEETAQPEVRRPREETQDRGEADDARGQSDPSEAETQNLKCPTDANDELETQDAP